MSTYEPALRMRLRVKRTHNKRLSVILAGDGTPLDTIEHDWPDDVPRWVLGLVQLPEVEVLPSVYREFKQNLSAITI